MDTARKTILILALLSLAVPALVRGEEGDPRILLAMERINNDLELQGVDFRLAQIELYTLGWGQPSNRVLMNGAHWIPNDPLRFADGDNITYLVVETLGATANGLSSSDTEDAIDRAMTTWNSRRALEKVDIVKWDEPLGDCTVFDEQQCWAAYDNDPLVSGWPFFADIVHAGWYPYDFFECFGPGGGHGILGVSVTFIWWDNALNEPTDLNGDNYLDTAFVEIYYNDNFGDPLGTRAGNPWGIDVELPGIDIETIALHESGHALGLGHFGPPPSALMNPYYNGMYQVPSPIDEAGMSALWRSWPNQ
ncbi:MAG: matrixin family metalloprotease [Planctomycetota bacterium]|jgi:hypothetical protein